MAADRITEIRIKGMRSLKDVTLKLSGLTVLIGENGCGKSTIVEAFELMRKVISPGYYLVDSIGKIHGDLRSLVRYGEDELTVSVAIEGAGPKLFYEFTLGFIGIRPVVRYEHFYCLLNDEIDTTTLFERIGDEITSPSKMSERFKLQSIWGALSTPDNNSQELLIFKNKPEEVPDLGRLGSALSKVQVHVAFDTRPLWVDSENGAFSGTRWPMQIDHAEQLDRQGANLANCFYTLRNGDRGKWEHVLDLARLGLGPDLHDITLPPQQRGNIGMEITFGTIPRPVPITALSEGQIAYLGFLAIAMLSDENSVVVFDEPELHLHPGLVARVAWMFEKLGKTCPVVLATHSDRLLDALEKPADSVVLCELDEDRATVLRRPNPEKLAEWLSDYTGLGSIRNDGFEAHVFDPS